MRIYQINHPDSTPTYRPCPDDLGDDRQNEFIVSHNITKIQAIPGFENAELVILTDDDIEHAGCEECMLAQN